MDAVDGQLLDSAVSCAGLNCLIGRPAEPRRIGPGLALIVTAMLLHAIWDSIEALTAGHPVLIFVLLVIGHRSSVIAFVVAIKMHAATPRRSLCDILAPEVSAGGSTPPSSTRSVVLAAPVGPLSRPDASRQNASAPKHVLDAAHDLTDALTADAGRAV